MAQLTITINTGNNMGATRNSERRQLSYLLDRVKDQLGDNVSLAETLYDQSGVAAGSWTYTPAASL